MGKQLVLVGGGHAHMVTIANLRAFVEKGHRVTVIAPSEHHYYSGMGPGLLGGTYSPSDVRFATKQTVEKQGGVFVMGKAARVRPAEKRIELESGETVSYDLVSFNVGSDVPKVNGSEGAENLYPVKPIENLIKAQAGIRSLVSRKPAAIGIIGGGPSSSEIAGNILHLTSGYANRPRVKIFARGGLMAGFPEGVRTRIEKSLMSRGVEIHRNACVQVVERGGILLESGERHDLDFIFLAVGVRPNALFERSGIQTGPDGGMAVNSFLQSTAYPEMFGGGDCIYFQEQPLDKVGVYAVRQNPVLFQNLISGLEGKPLRAFSPGGDYLLIFNMGGGKGVLRKKGLTFGGRVAFLLKDYIDRKFMKKFQAIE
ncbi:MAG: pyridine nucleotide-disulfide oxidoreductase [Desulfobacteraceae bacterium]|nr:MAG: pyridine nucleotide-disulfide oxidoreductase [Desulfobacteraceae bacterium]